MRLYDKNLDDSDEINLETFLGAVGRDPRIIWDGSPAGQDPRDQFVVVSLNDGDVKFRASLAGQTPFVPGNWHSTVDVGPQKNEDWPRCAMVETLSVDRPGLGFNRDAWLVSAITTNNQTPIGPYINNMFYVVDKDSMAVTGPIGSEVFVSTEAPKTLGCFQKSGLPGFPGRESAYPARHYGESPALYAVGAAAYLKSRDPEIGQESCSPGFKHLRLFAITGGASPSIPANYRFYDLEVPACYEPSTNYVLDESGFTFRATDGRIIGAEWREIVGIPLLFVCHEIQAEIPIDSASMTTAPQARIRWYVIQTNGWPQPGQEPALWKWGDIEHGTVEVAPGEARPVHTVFPAMAVNEQGDMGFTFALTSADQKLTVNATIRSFPLYLDEATVEAAESINTGPLPEDEFGDYFGVAVDPVDGSFWGIGSFVWDELDPVEQRYRWATQVFRFFD